MILVAWCYLTLVYLVLLSLYNQPTKSMLLSHTTDEEVLEKTHDNPSDSKEIKPANPKGNQSWTFIGRTDAEAPILWPPDVKSQLTGKYPDAGKDWRQKEKETTEGEMVGWHHWCDGHELSTLRELVMDKGTWRATVHVVARSQTWLNDWTELNC